MHVRLSVAMLLLALSLPKPVLADGPSVDEGLKRGMEMMRLGQYKDALAEFLRADRIAPSPRTESQIALAERALGSWSRAEALLTEALESVADPWIREHRRVLESSLGEIRTHVGEIAVETKPHVSALLKVNNDAHLIGKAVRVDEGDVVVDILADGYERSVQHVPVKAGSKVNELIMLVPRAPPVVLAPPILVDRAGAGEPTAAPPKARSRVMGTVLVIAGLAGLGVGSAVLAFDGTSACSASAVNCETTHATRLAAGLTLGFSAAAAALGATLLAR